MSTIASPSRRTLRGLDWLNFFLTDVPTGFTPFLAVYLAGYGWNVQNVGIALTVGGIAGIMCQTPMGALIDRLSSKRELFSLGVFALAEKSNLPMLQAGYTIHSPAAALP